jgi:hypothetical protein
MKRLEQITSDYWDVSTALKHPDAPGMSAEDAFKKLNSSDRLRPEEWRLSENMHIVRYDIIEGNDEWREKQQVHGSVLTLPTIK